MPTAIQFLRSDNPELRPNPDTLADGMPMLNTNEGEPGLFFRGRDSSLIKIGPVAIGADAPNANAQGFEGNAKGEMWLDTSGTQRPRLRVYTGEEWTDDPDVTLDQDQTITGQKTFTQPVVAEGGMIALGQDIFAESLILTGTATSAATDAGMQDNVLTTKGYVDSRTATPTLKSVLVAGQYIIGDSFNGSVDTLWRVDASITGTDNVVARDAAGNFSAGTITATLSGTAQNCSRSVEAGVGLIGGGELDQDRALAVFADGDTISVGGSGVKVNPDLSLTTLTLSGALTLTTATASGELELTTAGDGIILASPDGTRYRLTVTNAGALDIAAA